MTTYNRARAYLYALKETFPTITFVDGAGNDIDMSELEGVYSCCGSSYPLFSRDAIEESDIVTICAKCVTAVNTCEICGSRYRGEYCTNCFSRAKCDFCGVTTLCRIEDYAGNHVYLCPKHTKARKVQLMRHDFKPMFSYRRSIRCHA
jgi:hypothetical protein